ncbi:MAG TPA: hypothetical protein VEQ59_12560 [Polyangiaceae bacterium]|nr:hypothetical protein [Polyangiaceae bacterium]
MRFGGVLACSLGLLASCSRATPPLARTPRAPVAVAVSAAAAPKPSAPPRLFPPTHGPGTVDAGIEHDGSRRLLAFGLRALEHADGSLEVGDELLPAARSAKFLELPARLGAGFLFWIVSSSSTLLYRSESWTAKLEPLAQLDFEVERLVPGFDRLLVLPRREADYRALDVETGKAVPPLGLPAAPAYGAMAFVDGWFGAVQVPLRGVLLSFDAGESWHPLSLPVTSFEAAGDGLALSTASGDYLLDARGALSRVADRDEAKVSEAARAELAKTLAAPGFAAKRGDSLLETAVLSGFPDGKGGAFVATGGTLSNVRLDTGKVLERRERAYAGAAECHGVRFGDGVGFVCGQGRESTRIYRVTEPLGLEQVSELPGARVVSDSGSGALVVHGGCGEPRGAASHCVLRPGAAPLEIQSGSERDRVVALGDGRVAIVTPPDARGPGQLRVQNGGAVTRYPLHASPRDGRQKTLLAQGVWLDGMVEIRPGVLSGWVVGAGPFAGVELTLDGKLELRRVQDNAGRALFAGRRALVLGENGLASESTDGGVEWQGVELPPEIDLKGGQSAELRQGCSPLGCGFAGFTRVGYFEGRSARSLASPSPPPRVTFPGPGGSRWLLHCAMTGEASAPALPFKPASPLSSRRLRRSSAGTGEEVELAPLSPLLEQAPPPLPDTFEGVDAGTEPYGVQLRIYAYGPHGGDWTRAGALSISFADRFATKAGVLRTAPARSPWPDALTAADALGAEPSTNAAGLAAALDPGGAMGALALNSRGVLDLFMFEAGRVPLHIPNVGRLGMGARLSGVVKTKAGIFIGSYDESSRSFRVYRVVGQDLEVALEVSDIPPPRGASAELTRTAAGDALGIWVRSTGWYVHPIDLEAGIVDAPYQITPPQLATMPPPCADGAEGFLLTGSVTPDPSVIGLVGVSTRAFEGRFRASALGICVDSLALQGDGSRATSSSATAAAVRATGRPTVAATLTERKPLGRRVELRCSN